MAEELTGREAQRQADLEAAKKKVDEANRIRDERIAKRRAQEDK